MKSQSLILASCLLAGPLLAADSDTKNAVTDAAKKLAESANYTWQATVVVPESARFKPGPTEGTTEKDGFSSVTFSFGDILIETAFKDDKAVVMDDNGAWQSAADLLNGEGRERFLGRMVANYKLPASQATNLLAAAKELKKEGDTYSGEMTEAGAKSQYRFGEPINPKGSVKFWVKEGVIVKFEAKVEATMEFNGNDVDVTRTTTTEIKDLGTTTVKVPEAARKKLG